ncbi:MAG: DUF2269 family protein [Deltaproteobacteria bacterium]|jgi:hypothetical protein|nr:DUF2269 family protein [Deltaproteobacteria bacterium]
MAKFGAKGMRVLKTIHLVFAALWLGGSIGLNLMIIGLQTAESDGQLLGFNLACQYFDDAVLIPGAMGCLLSGLLICALTSWGFKKHAWVVVKWFLTIFCILFGTFALGPTVNNQPAITAELGLSALANPEYIENYYASLKGGVIQMVLLVFMFYVSVFKPFKGKKKDQARAA